MILNIGINGFNNFTILIIKEIQKRYNFKITFINDIILNNNLIFNFLLKSKLFIYDKIELINNYLIINGEIIILIHEIYLNKLFLYNINILIHLNNKYLLKNSKNLNIYNLILNPIIYNIKLYPIYILDINHLHYKNENIFYTGYYLINSILLIIKLINNYKLIKFIKIIIYLNKNIKYNTNIINWMLKYFFNYIKINYNIVNINNYSNTTIKLILNFNNNISYKKILILLNKKKKYIFDYKSYINKYYDIININNCLILNNNLSNQLNKNTIILNIVCNNYIFYINRVLDLINFI